MHALIYLNHLEKALTEVLKLGSKLPAAMRQVFSVRKPSFTKSATVSYEEQTTGQTLQWPLVDNRKFCFIFKQLHLSECSFGVHHLGNLTADVS